MEGKWHATAEFVAHATAVTSCAIGPKTSMVATGGDDCKLNIWRQDSTAIWSLGNNKSPVERVCFDTDEHNVVSGAANGSLKVFDLNEGRLARSLGGHKVNVSSLQYHPYGEFIVSGSTDTTMKVWDVRNKSCIQTYTGHDKDLTCVRFSPDGKWVASAAKDGQVLIWDLVAGKLLQSLRLQPAYARSFEFHPSEFIMAAVTSARTVRLWDLETMAPLCSTPPDGSFVRALAFVEGKRELCSATKDGVKVWGWETGSSSSGSGSSGGVFKLRASAGVQWEGVSELRVPPGSDSLLGCGFSANFVSVYSISLPDVIRSQSIRDGLGLEAKERGGERERERERERDKAERPERPPFSVIGSPEAIARTRAPSAAVSPPTTLGGAITGISGVGLLSSGGERPLSGFAAHASSLQAESKSPGSHREGPTAHRHDRHDRHGFKSVPSVRYHYDKEEDDASDLFQPRRVDRAADRGERGDRGDRGDAGGERGGDRERPERGDKESERERGPTGGRPSPREGRAAEPLSPDRGERAARGEAKDMSTSMGASFLRQEPFPLSPPQPQLQAQPHALSRQHPTSSPPRSEARHAYTAATCEAQCERMLQASAPFSSLLSTRLSSLRMLRRLWEKGDMADVVDYLCNIHETTRHDPLQLCLLADFFCAVHLRGNGLCLDSCVRLLPLLDSMLGQSRGLDAAGSGSGPGGGVHVCVAALRALVALCEAFGELIKSTRASAAGPSSAYSPVDLSREERLGKCNLCHSILLRARGQLAGLRERHARHAKSRRVGESADRLEELVSAL